MTSIQLLLGCYYHDCIIFTRNEQELARQRLIAHVHIVPQEAARDPYWIMRADDAYRYSKPEEYSVVTVPLPKLRDNDILVCISLENASWLEVLFLTIHRSKSRPAEVRFLGFVLGQSTYNNTVVCGTDLHIHEAS
jgi:hypothetical protein